MIENADEFDAELREFAVRIPRATTQVQRRVALEAHKRIVQKTPRDTGRARGNWQVTIGSPAVGETGIEDADGAATIARGEAALPAIPDYSTVYITNNVPYISVLEEGGFIPPDPGPSKDKRKGREGKILVSGGYSVQAPQGMVAVTLEEMRPIFDRLEEPDE